MGYTNNRAPASVSLPAAGARVSLAIVSPCFGATTGEFVALRPVARPAIFPSSNGFDSGAPSLQSLSCVQRPHNLFSLAESRLNDLPPASREKAPFAEVPSRERTASIAPDFDSRNPEHSPMCTPSRSFSAS